MSDYKGIIIEESLVDKTVLEDVKIIDTKVEPITDGHSTPWLTQWTLHTVLIPEAEIDSITKRISNSLDPNHHDSWYSDFKNESTHYVVFYYKAFKIDRSKPEQYQAAMDYGISLGIPKHQLDFYT